MMLIIHISLGPMHLCFARYKDAKSAERLSSALSPTVRVFCKEEEAEWYRELESPRNCK
jgi:hypothetical protein